MEKSEDKDVPNAQEEALKEPVLIAKSPAALVVRLMGLGLLTDLATLLIVALLLVLGVSARAAIALFVVMFFLKIIVFGVFIFVGVLHWNHLDYFLSESQLIMKKINQHMTAAEEDTHELRSIFKVTMEQSWMGRLFNFGHIHLEMTGYDSKVNLEDIKDPAYYKSVFDKYVSAPAA